MPEILLQRPYGEPISLDAAKLHLRVTESSQDALIAGLIQSARQAVETKTRRQLLHARWKLVQDRFPMAGIGTPLPFARQVNRPAYAIELPHSPMVAVESIRYVDMGGSWQTIDPSLYTVNNALEPAIISPVFGAIWPIALPQIGAVEVTYTAGYASPMARFGSTSQIQVSGPVAWLADDMVEFYNSGGALPTPLTEGTPYMIDAAAGGGIYSLKALDGTAVTLTDAGAGTNFIGVVPAGVRSWMLLRIGSLYENREEVAIISRGSVNELPFVDGLLDAYRTDLP